MVAPIVGAGLVLVRLVGGQIVKYTSKKAAQNAIAGGGKSVEVPIYATVSASAGIGTVPVNCNIATGTGSHKTGQSAMVLDADTPVLTQSQLRVIRRAPWDTGTGTSAGVTDAYPWYEVYLNNHYDRFQSTTVSSS